MSSSFAEFLREMEEEARQSGPDAEAAFFESQQRHWIGRRLYERRRELGYTQGKLSELSGINQSDISKIEHAEANPTLDTLSTLAGALKLTLALEPYTEAARALTLRRQPARVANAAINGVARLRGPAAAASRAAAANRPATAGARSSAQRSAPVSCRTKPRKGNSGTS